MDEIENERWVATSGQLPGIKCYGATKKDALNKLKNRAKDIFAVRQERGLDVRSGKLTVIIYKNVKKP